MCNLRWLSPTVSWHKEVGWPKRRQWRASLSLQPRVAEQLDSLERQHRQLTENLRDYNNRRLEAEVQTNLERRQLGEQFRVIEPAVPPSTWSSPNRQVIIVTAFLIGFSLGVAAAVISETSDSSIHASQQLQREFGVPVLASIPNILLAPDIALRRRRMIRRAAVAANLDAGAASWRRSI